MMRRSFDRITSTLGSLLRLNTGRTVLQRSADDIPTVHLTLYEYEASPWCRLVREHLTLLGLPVLVKPCPRQTLLKEGAFDERSRYRKEAWNVYLDAIAEEKQSLDESEVEKEKEKEKEKEVVYQYQFPILVDATTSSSSPKILFESSNIIHHLWENYSDTVIEDRPSVDIKLNSDGLPFFVRFPLLSGPSALRPFPHCGLLQLPSSFNDNEDMSEDKGSSNRLHQPLTLHGKEGDPMTRLVREKLCSLCISYYSIPMLTINSVATATEVDEVDEVEVEASKNSVHAVPEDKFLLHDPNPRITTGVSQKNGGGGEGMSFTTLDDAMRHLEETYGVEEGQYYPMLWSKVGDNNLGRSGWFGDAASSAMRKGGKYFVHPLIGRK